MSKDEKSYKLPMVKILALFAAGLFALTVATELLITSSENDDFRERYQEIAPGMSKSIVVSVLGTPNDRSSEFYLGQKEGSEEAYRRAEESGSADYFIWQLKNDEVYTVGFNEEDKVVIVEADGR